jgi:hypothetical protein
LEAPRDNSDSPGGGAAQTNSLRTLAPDYGMIRNVLSQFARFIEMIEKDIVTLAFFYFSLFTFAKD